MIFLLAIALSAVTHAAPSRPADDAEVLERLATPGDAGKRRLRRLRDELTRDPRDLDLATRLALRYMEMGRAESDPRYNGYAQAALAPWWNLDRPPIAVLVLRATLQQNRHDFSYALTDLKRVLSLDPRNGQAWLTQAVILQVQGKHADALQSCLHLRPLAGELVTATCVSSTASRNGRAAQSYQRLSQALEHNPDAVAPLRLWALTILAEIATALGDAGAAEQHFREALALGIRDSYLLSAYTDFLLDRGRADAVVSLLGEETKADDHLLRLALAEQRLKAPELAEHVEALSARFAASRRRGDVVHRREEARFTLHLLNQPVRALELAKANWQVQREPWDARLVLEAALAAGDPEAAAPVLDWLKKSGLEDIQIQSLVERLAAEQQ